MGYTYYGSKTDWTGWDNGNRSVPSALKDYFNSDTVINPTSDLAQQLGGLLVNGRNAVVQRDDHVQPNFSVDVSAGTKWELGEFTLGVIAAGGYSNKTQTKAITQQRAQGLTADPNQLFENFQAVNTDNRVVANGLLGLGLEWGENSVRWTNVYIHDTDKHASLRLGKRENNPNADYMEQTTAWYERQLIDTQFVGEFHPPTTPRSTCAPVTRTRSASRPSKSTPSTCAPTPRPTITATTSSTVSATATRTRPRSPSRA